MDNNNILNNENQDIIKAEDRKVTKENSQEESQNDQDLNIDNTNSDVTDDAPDVQLKISKELEQKTLELEGKEKELNARQLRMDATNILYDKNLPIDMLEFVLGEDLDSTKIKINKFQELFNTSVQKHVLEKLKGSPLKTGNISTGQNYTSIVRNAIRG